MAAPTANRAPASSNNSDADVPHSRVPASTFGQTDNCLTATKNDLEPSQSFGQATNDSGGAVSSNETPVDRHVFKMPMETREWLRLRKMKLNKSKNKRQPEKIKFWKLNGLSRVCKIDYKKIVKDRTFVSLRKTSKTRTPTQGDLDRILNFIKKSFELGRKLL
ncbi:uncharacterized protein LOC106011547 [Aplysia californica]|uniref:Uncharacterized protein LOC106011547 n=1 Tax=Aplysia californica TaxID=6500 RepID=A0ABM1VS43_APLCA|nr:uncharacterized protein LOC106011547 [Aplysia californica]